MRLVLLFSVTLLLSVDCFTLPEQKNALIVLYNATGGPFWTIPFPWKHSTDPCTSSWWGVRCDPLKERVIELFLIGYNLTGSLPDLQLPDLRIM